MTTTTPSPLPLSEEEKMLEMHFEWRKYARQAKQAHERGDLHQVGR